LNQEAEDETFVTATKIDLQGADLPTLKPKLINANDIMKNQSLLSISNRSSIGEITGLSAKKPVSNRNFQREILNKTTVETLHRARVSSLNLTPGLRYKQGMIPTNNLKFEQLVKVVFDSKLTKEEQKNEILAYVQGLETQWADRI
jgi:hypothetical protein